MLSGKDREIQQREQLFLDVASQILLEDGYSEVSISQIAERTGFSRGTVYQRFSSKEELITTLGLQCRKRLLDAVTWAANFDAATRVRLVGIGEIIRLYFNAYPNDQHILKIIDSELILDKVSDEQREQMQKYDVHIFSVLIAVVQEAIDAGDLELRDGTTPQSLVFAFWAMMDGAFAARMGGAPLEEAGIEDPIGEIARNGHYLLDGYGWRPLSKETGYEKSAAKMRADAEQAFKAGTVLTNS